MRGTDWLSADPYLWRHLADHAAAGGLLDLFVKDVGYLAVADPTRLLPALRSLTDPEARRIAELYQRAADRLYTADPPIERMALLHLTAHLEASHLAHRLEPLLRPRWRCRWASWRPTSPHRTFSGHNDEVASVALGEIDGELVIVSGGWDRTVRVWNARTGEPRGDPLTGHDFLVASVALGEIDGEPVIVSGGWDRTVRVWEPGAHRVLVTVELSPQIAQIAPGSGGVLAVASQHGLVVLDLSTPLPSSRSSARPLDTEVQALARRARLDLAPHAASTAAAAGPPTPADQLGLTPREAEVLALVAAGRSNRQIAQALFISPKTASVHVSNILAKLGVARRVEAAAIAHRLGLD